MAAINELEAQADAAETQPSEIRWEQARQVAAALDAGMTTRQLAAEWKKADGSSYSHAHVGMTARAWRAFGNHGFQDRPTFYAAYHSPEVRGKAAEAKGAHVANNSGDNEWYTPADIIGAARTTMGGIDVDPATSEIAQKTVKAARFYTKDDDGLSKSWHGRIWMNPPYAQPLIGQFVGKLQDEMAIGNAKEAIVLVNNGTETAWGQTLLTMASAVCFPKSRIRFLDAEGNPGAPLQGQMIVYVGPHTKAFRKAFETFGAVL